MIRSCASARYRSTCSRVTVGHPARNSSIVKPLDLRNELGWEHLRNLQDLRNAIVHRGGKRGTSPDHQKTMDRLLEAYPGRVIFPAGKYSIYGQVWLSMKLCRQFAQEVERFFKRLFTSLGLPGKGMSLDG